MRFKADGVVRRIGQNEAGTIKDIREPDEHIVRLNPAAETMYWIQLRDDSCVWAKESELELVLVGQHKRVWT